MSDIKYGLISKVDAGTLEKTIDLICETKNGFGITILEIGIYSGQTASALRRYSYEKHKAITIITGIDNLKDGQDILFKDTYNELILGDADGVAFKIKDNSQDLIFIDACHCFAHVVSNFFSYAPKVKVGGYLAFHDTGAHIKPFKDFQHGDKENPDAYISVRKALKSIGLFRTNYYGHGMLDEWVGSFGFELIFDESDHEDEAGGICCFKKLR